MTARTCMDCGKQITQYSRTGRCISCSTKARFADPEWRAKHAAALRAAAATPEYREARRQAGLKRYADPAARKATSDARKAGLERNPELLQRMREVAVTNLAEARAKSTIDWSAWRRERQAWRRVWCSADRWDEYQKLRTTRGIGAAEAKRMILEDIAAKDRARIAAMTSHERAMERVRNGATLTTKPVMRKADHAFSLTGSSMG